MKQLPFIVEKFVFVDESVAKIVPLDDTSGVEGKIPGYFVMSSAPPNIEDAEESSDRIQQQALQGISDIADHLHRMMNTPSGEAELVITVHGYNTSLEGVQAWYKSIFKYVNRHDPTVSNTPNRLFVGYRWPSENVALSQPSEVIKALAALPPLPRDLLMTGVVCAVGLLVLELFLLFETSIWGFLVTLVLVLFFTLGMLMLALVVMRLVVYFRDNYRADNFGVLDLVELLRQVDQAVVKRTAAELFPQAKTEHEQQEALIKAREYWQQKRQKKRVKLSFIGHSMGGFVVTNVIRILSDVFDSRSIDKQPPSDVGDVYRLERLILASPDIPVLTIVSSRANFLSSSLRRFSESYLFCNEGDIALRIASTAANYIAFPSRTQARGYRLGNVALQNKTGSVNDYGLVNLDSLDHDFPVELSVGEAIARSKINVMDNLFLTYERFQARGVVTLADLFKVQAQRDTGRATVADFFTYFDCTDYTDVKYDLLKDTCSPQPVGILTRALGRSVLKPWDYFQLTLDYGSGKRDVHGGYFEGQFSQQLLYRLAFLGFSGYLDTLDSDRQVALSQLQVQCQTMKIQSYLSPMRYRVSIQNGSVDGTKTEMLDAMRVKG